MQLIKKFLVMGPGKNETLSLCPIMNQINTGHNFTTYFSTLTIKQRMFTYANAH